MKRNTSSSPLCAGGTSCEGEIPSNTPQCDHHQRMDFRRSTPCLEATHQKKFQTSF